MHPLVELDSIRVTVARRRVLSDLCWRLQPGEHWGITGANGAGKTTLLRVIRGDQWPDRGIGKRRYCLSGAGFESVREAKTQIAFVSPELQERHVRLGIEQSAWAVIAAAAAETDYLYEPPGAEQRALIDRLIAALRLGDFASKAATKLSQGQVRRLLIARALARRPRILLLDEWASGLDAAARNDVAPWLEQIAQTTPIVVTSHRREDFPPWITHRAVLRHGTLIAAPERAAPAEIARPARSPRAAKQARTADLLIDMRDANVLIDGDPVLHDICWQIRRGEQWLVEGPNGAGKTTLVKLVAGLLQPALGAHLERFGERGKVNVWRLKARIALLSDELQTSYEWSTIARNVIASGFFSSVGLFNEPDEAQWSVVDRLIARLELADLAQRPYPQLSFGERRKVLIARALTRTPDLMIVDEAFNGLDASFRERFVDLLHDYVEAGGTCLIVAHHEEDRPAFSTHRLVLAAGRIVSASTL